MFALTAHLEAADQRTREHRNLGMLIVALTALGAIAAGLAVDFLSRLDAFAGLV